ncbi:MAG: phosphate ABC transporter ATP-binding protein [Polymorphobacter sp.]
MLATGGLTIGESRHDAGSRIKVSVRNLNVWYDHHHKHALRDINLDIYQNEVTALIGPSGCGKSTFIKCLNRMIETIDGASVEGQISIDDEDVFRRGLEIEQFRSRIGWVAQQPNPFPRSIHDNVSYGAGIHGIVHDETEMDALVEECLREADLWDEVKDRLDEPGTRLSGGQQQRLCIARALSTRPDIILMDEPCSALGPAATAKVEDLIDGLRRNHTIIIVTHNMQQAARVSQRVAYFHLGEVLEVGNTCDVMVNPTNSACQSYITGRFG